MVARRSQNKTYNAMNLPPLRSWVRGCVLSTRHIPSPTRLTRRAPKSAYPLPKERLVSEQHKRGWRDCDIKKRVKEAREREGSGMAEPLSPSRLFYIFPNRRSGAARSVLCPQKLNTKITGKQLIYNFPQNLRHRRGQISDVFGKDAATIISVDCISNSDGC